MRMQPIPESKFCVAPSAAGCGRFRCRIGTLTALGTVYSQMLLIDARHVNSARTQRLPDSIVDQVNSLQDVPASIKEVYGDQQVAARSSVRS